MEETTILSLAEAYKSVYEERRSPEELRKRAKQLGDRQTINKVVGEYNKGRQDSRKEDPKKYYAEEYECMMEEADIAAYYFYEEGINESGLEIIIEELGVEEFVEWVEELTNSTELTEARAARRAKKSSKSYEQVKAEIDAKEAARAAAKAATKKPKTPERKAAVVKAKAVQAPTPASKPKRGVLDNLAKGIFSASDAVKKGKESVGNAFRAGVERHNKAMKTAGKVSKDVGQIGSKVGKIAGEFGKGVSSGVKTAGSVAKKVVEEEEIIGYLISEGFADNETSAEVLLTHMSDEWLNHIIESEKPFPYKKVGDKMRSIDKKIVNTESPKEKNKLKSRYNKIAGEYWQPN